MWDSRGTGVKVPRLFNSIVRAYDVFEYRKSAQFFASTDYEGAGVTAEKGEKGLKKLADAGMADVPAPLGLGGIEARGGICREATLNLVTLRDVIAIIKKQIAKKEVIDKDASHSATIKLQRYLLGLALVSMTWFDSKTLNLRQGCQLVGVPGKPMSRICINADGTETDFPIDRDTATEYAKNAADEFGIEEIPEAQFDPKKAKEALKKVVEEVE
jgi:CRISPR-associated protein Csb1